MPCGGVPTRFTFDTAIDLRPVWSPDGSRVVFTSNRKGVNNLYWKLSSGTGADELLLESDQGKAATGWSFNGRFLLFRSNDPQTGFDLWVLPVSGDKKPFPFLKTPFEERDGQSLENGTPAALFPVRIAGGPLPGINKQQYAVSSDGQRFLVNLAVDEGVASPITLILNWHPRRGK